MLSEIKLPPDVTKYKQTKTFDATTVPKGLLKDHSTKTGVWGCLKVHSGVVTYTDVKSAEIRDIAAGSDQVIEPEALHFIQPSQDAEFHVEFYQNANGGNAGPHKGKPLF